MLGRQGAILFCNPWDIRTSVVDLDVFGGETVGEKDYVGFSTRAVRRKGSVGEAENRVQIAILGQDLEDISGLVGKKDVIRNDDCCSSTRL
jgi:hypothetical protein